MFHLKLTHGLSHDNGYVRATKKHPFVTVEDEAVARFCVDSGFFEIVNGDKASETPAATADNAPSAEPAISTMTPAEPGAASDDEELEAMSVAELKAYAETTGVDLGKATKKADIIAAIRRAEAE